MKINDKRNILLSTINYVNNENKSGQLLEQVTAAVYARDVVKVTDGGRYTTLLNSTHQLHYTRRLYYYLLYIYYGAHCILLWVRATARKSL